MDSAPPATRDASATDVARQNQNVGTLRPQNRFFNVPTELVRMIGQYLSSQELRNLALTCRKVNGDIRDIIARWISIDVARDLHRLPLLVRACLVSDSTVSHSIKGLSIEYNDMEIALYEEGVEQVAAIPRLGKKYWADDVQDRYELREDFLLYRLLCSAHNLKSLRLEIFGDILPAMRAPPSFLPNLRTLFLRRIPHGYGENVDNYNPNIRTTSMKTLARFFLLPHLQEVTLDTFLFIEDVGAVSEAYASHFTPKSITMIETGADHEDSSFMVPEDLTHFFRAFKALERVEWRVSRLIRDRVRAIASIVQALSLHADTLKTLVLTESKQLNNCLDRFEWDTFVENLALEETEDIDFTGFTVLQELRIIDQALMGRNLDSIRSNDHLSASDIVRRLPTNLEKLSIFPFGENLMEALWMATILRLWNEEQNTLYHLQPHFIHFIAERFSTLFVDSQAEVRPVSALWLDDRDGQGLRAYMGLSGTFPRGDDPPEVILADSLALLEKYCERRRAEWRRWAQAGALR